MIYANLYQQNLEKLRKERLTKNEDVLIQYGIRMPDYLKPDLFIQSGPTEDESKIQKVIAKVIPFIQQQRNKKEK